MIDIIANCCKTELCDTIANSKKYKGYCCRCFINLFPDNKISKIYKVKEQHMVDFINLHFKDYVECYDKIIQDGCSRRRPDCLIKLNDYNIIIECDENQHKNGDYSCNNKRTMELFNDLGNSLIIFIRFNPDSYINNKGKKKLSSFKYHQTLNVPTIRNKEEWNGRLNKLKETVEYYLNNLPKKEVEEVKLFYDIIS